MTIFPNQFKIYPNLFKNFPNIFRTGYINFAEKFKVVELIPVDEAFASSLEYLLKALPLWLFFNENSLFSEQKKVIFKYRVSFRPFLGLAINSTALNFSAKFMQPLLIIFGQF